MRNHSILFWVLLFMDGVFVAVTDDVKPVSVMKGDSVILNTGASELSSDDTIEWIFKEVIIAKIEGEKQIKINGFSDGRFGDRLELDRKSGSLTIKDITNEHEGLYKLDIRGIKETSKRFSVTVNDVVKSLSVMEGDTITLHTGVTDIQRDDQIQWKFGDQGDLIARLNSPVDTKWSNIHLNDQTGEITITNIQNDQCGVYKVEINTSRMILRQKFRITHSDEMKTTSVMAGDYVTLHTGVIEIRDYDLILWKCEDHLMAKINRTANQFSSFDSVDGGRFRGRLELHLQTGSLIIRDSRTTDSGTYHLHMNNITYTLQRTFSVTVSGLSLVVIAVICVSVALVAAVAIGIYFWHRSRGRAVEVNQEVRRETDQHSSVLLPMKMNDSESPQVQAE